jgi:hypothetical protein
VTELIICLIAIRVLPSCGQGQVAVAAQRILQPSRAHGTELVSETKVNVVEEASGIRAVVLDGVERFHDVLLASLTVLRIRGQVSQVDQKIVRPVLDVFVRG